MDLSGSLKLLTKLLRIKIMRTMSRLYFNSYLSFQSISALGFEVLIQLPHYPAILFP